MPRPQPREVYIAPVDDLPGDNDDDVIEPQTEWQKKAEFRAAVGGAHFNNSGEFVLTLKVPPEDKYLAIPLTDVRNILMVFSAYEPIQNENSRDADLDAVWRGE